MLCYVNNNVPLNLYRENNLTTYLQTESESQYAIRLGTTSQQSRLKPMDASFRMSSCNLDYLRRLKLIVTSTWVILRERASQVSSKHPNDAK